MLAARSFLFSLAVAGSALAQDNASSPVSANSQSQSTTVYAVKITGISANVGVPAALTPQIYHAQVTNPLDTKPDFMFGSNFEDGNCGFEDGVLSPVLPFVASVPLPCPAFTIINTSNGGALRGNSEGDSDGVEGLSDAGSGSLSVGVRGYSTDGSWGVVALSDTGNGIYGESQSAGVWGSSSGPDAGDDGVHGESSAGVGQGSGVAGFNSSSGSGVFGLSVDGHAMVGDSSGDAASGVAGLNTGDGFGVYATGGSGHALYADGPASQPLGAGGLVKFFAKILVDDNSQAGFAFRCFNSQLPASQASSGACDITVSSPQRRQYVVDFHKDVSGRFAFVNLVNAYGASASIGQAPAFNLSNSQVGVMVFDDLDAVGFNTAYEIDVVVY